MFTNHAGINLTDTKLQIVEIAYKEDSFFLETLDQIFHPEPFHPGLPEDKLINILQNAINKLNKKKELISRNISFSLPNNFFKIFEVPYDDSLVKKDLVDHFKWELSTLYPDCDCENYLLQHIEVDKSSLRTEKQAIVIGIDKLYVIALNKFCEQNNYQLKFIDNVHLASNAFLYLDKPKVDNEISLSIYIDQKYSSLAAMDGVHPFFFKILDPASSNIFEELTATVNKLGNFKLAIKDFRKVLLYGQDITEEFENKLKTFFGLPLKKINPFERLKADETVLKNPLYKIKYNSFTAAAGIAIRII